LVEEPKRKVDICYLIDHLKKFHKFWTSRRPPFWISKCERVKINGNSNRAEGPLVSYTGRLTARPVTAGARATTLPWPVIASPRRSLLPSTGFKAERNSHDTPALSLSPLYLPLSLGFFQTAPEQKLLPLQLWPPSLL
jgi:hypothetical protein